MFVIDFGPPFTTGDPEVAKERVNSLKADGGGDCPELGMSGLYLAVLNSLPNSDVYYFSEADAKDANLSNTVISLALTKQCRISPFISGRCSSRRRKRSTTGQDIYKKLASATGGQLIEFSKSNIKEAIKLIRPANIFETNSSSLFGVSLLSVEFNAKRITRKTYNVQSDSTITSITAVLSAVGNSNIVTLKPKGTVRILII